MLLFLTAYKEINFNRHHVPHRNVAKHLKLHFFFPLETNIPFSVDKTLFTNTEYSLSILDKSQLHVTDLIRKTQKL